MKTIIKLTFLSLSMATLTSSFAQTGPGGVGNSSSVMLWLDANTISQANNTQVNSWVDQSGNGNNASAAGSVRPRFFTNIVNGKPVLRFSGTNYMNIGSIAGLSNTSNISWMVVGQTNNTTQVGHLIASAYSGGAGNGGAAHMWKTILSNTTGAYHTFARDISGTGGSGTINLGYNASFNFFESTWNGGTDIVSGYRNGTLIGNQTGANANPTSHTRIRIGSNSLSSASQIFTGDIPEVMVFNVTLNDVQRIIIENYIGAKYNLSVANDFYAFQATHEDEVAGIGMTSGISHNDSRGTSIVEISSADALDNGDFLFWGHDNAALTENTTDVSPTMLANRGTRLERVWRLDETGDVGTYTVSIDMTGISVGLDPDAYVLLTDDDGDFTNGGTTEINTNFSYNVGTEVATWTNVDMGDGVFFTIAYSPIAIFSITTGPWNTPSTWNCTCVPEIGNNVIVSAGDVVTVDGLSFSNNLTVDVTGSLVFSGDNELMIAGNLVNSGSLDGTDGILTMNGTFGQTMDMGAVNLDALNIDNAGGVVLNSGTIQLNDVITIVNGDFDIGTDLITLNSDATSTARIGQSNGTMTGSMIVQRYIEARNEASADLSSPVFNATFAQWDVDLEMAFGEYIPDVSEPSAYGYDEGTLFDFYGIESDAETIVAGVGYEVYLDTDADNQTPFPATTLNLSGTPNIGDVNVAVTVNNDGWNLIGNPYASFIDWDNFRNNAGITMNTDFMYYDGTIYDYSYGTSGDVIAQGQGFWIEATSAGNATFQEINKTTDNTSDFRKAKEALLGLRVSSPDIKFTSGTYFRFDNNSDRSFEANHDLSFLPLANKKAPALFTTSTEGKKLKINELRAESSLSLPLNFKAGFEGSYVITLENIEAASMQGYSKVILEDTKYGILFDLSTGNYEFESVSGDSENRFVFHLNNGSNAEIPASGDVKVIQTSEGVFADFDLELATDAMISVYNLAGQEIAPGILAYVERNRVEVKIPQDYHGVYLVRVIVGDKSVTQRLFKH